MIPRDLTPKMLELAGKSPAVTVTGPRQSGKSTLVRAAFPKYRYVSLEDPDMRALAADDPRSFLARFDDRVVFDEVQRVPSLFSYMQGVLDEGGTPGRFILSGSQNFLLLKSISQSLAGRVAVLHLLPLSYAELSRSANPPASMDAFLMNGGYPRLNAMGIDPADYFPSYIATYLDRDIREELGVRKIAEFNTFITLCATRVGDVLNVEGLANDCDISVDTARSWLSVLESSYIVFRLHPYHRNYGKRLVKAPKLYFRDTGLAAYLLGIDSVDAMATSAYRGNLYENAVVTEIVKRYEALGHEPRLFYWRDSNKKEIDLVIEKGARPQYVIEVKSSATYRPSAFRAIEDIAPQMGLPPERRFVVYGGDESFETKHGQVLAFSDLGRLIG